MKQGAASSIFPIERTDVDLFFSCLMCGKHPIKNQNSYPLVRGKYQELCIHSPFVLLRQLGAKAWKMKMLARSVLVLVIFDAALTAPTTELFNYDSEVYDAILEDVEPFYNYEQIPINQVQTEKVTERLSGSRVLLTPGPELEDTQDEDKDEESTPRLIDGSSPQEPEFPGLLGPHTNEDFPTCLLCTCISTTVYCDDHELDAIPPLPKKTAYFYSRFNRIKKINQNDFASLSDLKRIDLTSNLISEIDEDAFRKLPHLQELVLRDNKIKQLPELPATLTFIDISNNRLGRKGIKQEAFKDMYDLHHLYITDNSLDHIPLPLPESLQALHLQVSRKLHSAV